FGSTKHYLNKNSIIIDHKFILVSCYNICWYVFIINKYIYIYIYIYTTPLTSCITNYGGKNSFYLIMS
ncbi:MAG: hypothetical protein MCS20_01295, partial [Candidatus Phytoplasma mali]|nr:hypothetical protein [Candidatus Phytoplasma australiense]MCG7202034.1 hypothetical protein [Candidatus Phytoplasma mali]